MTAEWMKLRQVRLQGALKDAPEVRSLLNLLGKFDVVTSIAVNAPTVIAGFPKLLQGTPFN